MYARMYFIEKCAVALQHCEYLYWNCVSSLRTGHKLSTYVCLYICAYFIFAYLCLLVAKVGVQMQKFVV